MSPRSILARLNDDGSLDNSFLSGMAGPKYSVRALAIQGDGKILVGGSFQTFNGIPRTSPVRINPDGSLDDSFLAAADSGSVNAIAFQGDGKILIGGGITLVDQTPRSYVARLLNDYAPPVVVTQPSTQTAEVGATAWFGLEATGAGVLTYQWFFYGTQALGAPPPTVFFELTGLQSLNGGSYTFAVSDGVLSVTSAPATLNVIPTVGRRIVPVVKLLGAPGSLLHLESIDSLKLPHDWQPLVDVTLAGPSEYYFDVTSPLPQKRFMRARQVAPVTIVPECRLSLVPALTVTGHVGEVLRIDCINCIGPTNAWVTLDTVTLTNTSQLYFDVSAPYQPAHVYRLVPVP